MKKGILLTLISCMLLGLTGCAAEADNLNTNLEQQEDSYIESEVADESDISDETASPVSKKNIEKLTSEDIEIIDYNLSGDGSSVIVTIKYNEKEGLKTSEDILENYDFILNAYYQGADHTADREYNYNLFKNPGLVDVQFVFDNDLNAEGFLLDLKIIDKEDGTVIYSEEPKYLTNSFKDPLTLVHGSWVSAIENGIIQNKGTDIDFELLDSNLSITDEFQYKIEISAKIKNKTNNYYKIPNLMVSANKNIIFIIKPDVEELKPNEEKEVKFISIEDEIGEIYDADNRIVIYSLVDENNSFAFVIRESKFIEQLKTFSTNIY